jgi:hypothetical protein
MVCVCLCVHVPNCAFVPARWSVSMPAPNVSVGAVAESCPVSATEELELVIVARPALENKQAWGGLRAWRRHMFPTEITDSCPSQPQPQPQPRRGQIRRDEDEDEDEEEEDEDVVS